MDVAEKLIKLVRRNRCLYDPGSDDYRKLHKKEEIWADIGKRVRLSTTHCKKRWKGLRDTYKRRKRAEELPASSSTEFTKQWKYMDCMRFLDDCRDAKDTTENVFAELLDYPELPSVESVKPSKFDDFDRSMGLTESDTSASAYANEQTQATNPIEPAKNQEADAVVVFEFQKILEECANSVKELATTVRPAKQERNATSLLFESLAKTISEASIPIERKRQIECEVVQLVYRQLAQWS